MLGCYNIRTRQVARWLERRGYQLRKQRGGHPKYERAGCRPIELPTRVDHALPRNVVYRLRDDLGYESVEAVLVAIKRGE